MKRHAECQMEVAWVDWAEWVQSEENQKGCEDMFVAGESGTVEVYVAKLSEWLDRLQREGRQSPIVVRHILI
jgi:hypothetical protein